MRVLGVAGSLRRDSHNRACCGRQPSCCRPTVEFVEFDGLKDLPPFDEDDEPAPGPAVERWRQAIREADVLLFATPEYNGSVPGWLKNAIDWGSRPFADPALRNKPAAVIGASTGMFGAVWAQAELRKVLAMAGARVVDRELPVPAVHELLAADGGLAAQVELIAELDELLGELLESGSVRLAA